MFRQVVSLHFILLLIKTPDDHSITCSVLKCTYFPLSEPIPILTSHHHNQPLPSPSKPNE